MNVAMVVVTVVLLIQGTRIVVRAGSPPFVRCFGLLTLLLAGLSFVLFAILFWGEAILSPEFDVVMARGHWRGRWSSSSASPSPRGSVCTSSA